MRADRQASCPSVLSESATNEPRERPRAADRAAPCTGAPTRVGRAATMDADMNEPPAVAGVVGPDSSTEPFHGSRPSCPCARPPATRASPGRAGLDFFERLGDRIITNRGPNLDQFHRRESMAWILWVLHPAPIVADTTPTGGDMVGARCGRLPTYATTCCPRAGYRLDPDWYDGFPAFQYYMAVVMLNVGLAVVAGRSSCWPPSPASLRCARPPRQVARARPPCSWSCSASACPTASPRRSWWSAGWSRCRWNAWAMGGLAGLTFPGPSLRRGHAPVRVRPLL